MQVYCSILGTYLIYHGAYSLQSTNDVFSSASHVMSIASMQAYHKKSFESYVSYRRTGGYGPGDSKNGVSCRIPIRRNMG
jgi:hypothetical protein